MPKQHTKIGIPNLAYGEIDILGGDSAQRQPIPERARAYHKRESTPLTCGIARVAAELRGELPEMETLIRWGSIL